jgi:hypothetical protein
LRKIFKIGVNKMCIFANYKYVLQTLSSENYHTQNSLERSQADNDAASYFFRSTDSMKRQIMHIAMSSSRFSVIEQVLTEDDWQRLAQNADFVILCAQKGWTVGLRELKRRKANLHVINEKGDNLPLVAMKNNRIETAQYLVEEEHINPDCENFQKDSASNIARLINVIGSSCFKGGSPFAAGLTELIETYGSKRLEGTIISLNKEIGSMHSVSLELLRKELKYEHPFRGEPIVIGLEDDQGVMLPKLAWQDNRTAPYRTEKGIACAYQIIQTYLDRFPEGRRFKNVDELTRAFQFVKKEPFPVRYTRNGCQHRGPWLQYIFGNLLNYETKMIAVWLDNESFDLQPPFDPNIKWKMHTVAVVYLEDGTPYAMDTVLGAPIPLEDWKKAIAGNRGVENLSWVLESGKERNVLDQFGYYKPDMEQIIFILRNYYLNEHCLTERTVPESEKRALEKNLLTAVRIRDFATAQIIWSNNNWDHLVNDRKFLFQIAKVGWMWGIIDLRRRGANLVQCNGKGETPAHVALKNGEVGVAHYFVNEINISAYRADNSGETAHKIHKLIDRIGDSKFFLLNLKDPLFKKLIKKYSAKKVRKAVESLNEECSEQTIFDRKAFTLLKLELKYNKPFKGHMYVDKLTIKEGLLLPKLKWKKNIDGLPLTANGIPVKSQQIKDILDGLPKKRRVTDQQLLSLFNFLTRAPLSTKNRYEGARERASWMEKIASGVLNYGTRKVEGFPAAADQSLNPRIPFPSEIASSWKFHTTLAIKNDKEEMFALDPALLTPIRLKDWCHSLAGNKRAAGITWYISNEGAAMSDVSMYLRTLHLNEYKLAGS